MSKASRYSPEFRQRAVHLFPEQQVHHTSKWAALNAIAGKVGCTAETEPPGFTGGSSLLVSMVIPITIHQGMWVPSHA